MTMLVIQAAGENTLDALITRLVIQSMISKNTFDVADYRSKYITFMTTPGSHNDTYAGYRLQFYATVSVCYSKFTSP